MRRLPDLPVCSHTLPPATCALCEVPALTSRVGVGPRAPGVPGVTAACSWRRTVRQVDSSPGPDGATLLLAPLPPPRVSPRLPEDCGRSFAGLPGARSEHRPNMPTEQHIPTLRTRSSCCSKTNNHKTFVLGPHFKNDNGRGLGNTHFSIGS